MYLTVNGQTTYIPRSATLSEVRSALASLTSADVAYVASISDARRI